MALRIGIFGACIGGPLSLRGAFSTICMWRMCAPKTTQHPFPAVTAFLLNPASRAPHKYLICHKSFADRGTDGGEGWKTTSPSLSLSLCPTPTPLFWSRFPVKTQLCGAYSTFNMFKRRCIVLYILYIWYLECWKVYHIFYNIYIVNIQTYVNASTRGSSVRAMCVGTFGAAHDTPNDVTSLDRLSSRAVCFGGGDDYTQAHHSRAFVDCIRLYIAYIHVLGLVRNDRKESLCALFGRMRSVVQPLNIWLSKPIAKHTSHAQLIVECDGVAIFATILFSAGCFARTRKTQSEFSSAQHIKLRISCIMSVSNSRRLVL